MPLKITICGVEVDVSVQQVGAVLETLVKDGVEIPESLLVQLARHEDWHVRARVAGFEPLAVSVVACLVCDPAAQVRIELADNFCAMSMTDARTLKPFFAQDLSLLEKAAEALSYNPDIEQIAADVFEAHGQVGIDVLAKALDLCKVFESETPGA